MPAFSKEAWVMKQQQEAQERELEMKEREQRYRQNPVNTMLQAFAQTAPQVAAQTMGQIFVDQVRYRAGGGRRRLQEQERAARAREGLQGRQLDDASRRTGIQERQQWTREWEKIPKSRRSLIPKLGYDKGGSAPARGGGGGGWSLENMRARRAERARQIRETAPPGRYATNLFDRSNSRTPIGAQNAMYWHEVPADGSNPFDHIGKGSLEDNLITLPYYPPPSGEEGNPRDYVKNLPYYPDPSDREPIPITPFEGEKKKGSSKKSQPSAVPPSDKELLESYGTKTFEQAMKPGAKLPAAITLPNGKMLVEEDEYQIASEDLVGLDSEKTPQYMSIQGKKYRFVNAKEGRIISEHLEDQKEDIVAIRNASNKKPAPVAPTPQAAPPQAAIAPARVSPKQAPTFGIEMPTQVAYPQYAQASGRGYGDWDLMTSQERKWQQDAEQKDWENWNKYFDKSVNRFLEWAAAPGTKPEAAKIMAQQHAASVLALPPQYRGAAIAQIRAAYATLPNEQQIPMWQAFVNRGKGEGRGRLGKVSGSGGGSGPRNIVNIPTGKDIAGSQKQITGAVINLNKQRDAINKELLNATGKEKEVLKAELAEVDAQLDDYMAQYKELEKTPHAIKRAPRKRYVIAGKTVYMAALNPNEETKFVGDQYASDQEKSRLKQTFRQNPEQIKTVVEGLRSSGLSGAQESIDAINNATSGNKKAEIAANAAVDYNIDISGRKREAVPEAVKEQNRDRLDAHRAGAREKLIGKYELQNDATVEDIAAKIEGVSARALRRYFNGDSIGQAPSGILLRVLDSVTPASERASVEEFPAEARGYGKASKNNPWLEPSGGISYYNKLSKEAQQMLSNTAFDDQRYFEDALKAQETLDY
tara:strand:+ start:368 stop:2983 length:2616 start_codon:yes stop_codon:yes gene_type:complete